MLEQEQKIWLSSNASKVQEFENFMMTLADMPPMLGSGFNVVQVIDSLFYEWEFQSKYAMMFTPSLSNGSYETLISSWMFDMRDSWQDNRDNGSLFSDSDLWKNQKNKNEQAMQQALLIPTLQTKKDRAQFLGLSGVTSDVKNFLGDAAKFVPMLLIVIAILYGWRTFKK